MFVLALNLEQSECIYNQEIDRKTEVEGKTLKIDYTPRKASTRQKH